MHKTELRVRGSAVAELPSLLADRLRGDGEGSVERYAGDGFDVVAVESYYLRTNSDQQSTVILERTGDDACAVTILSGGGGTGLLGFNLGSESKQAREIASLIEELCDGEELRVEPD